MERDDLASYVHNQWVQWSRAKQDWADDMKELRNYIFQTDTTQTTNKKLPWKNSTSVPKLTQIRDNLHANYMAALFPHDDWFKWEAAEKDSASREKAAIIEAYMKQKIRESDFKKVVSQLLYDYIDYGNVFAEVTFETDSHTTPDGFTVTSYNGPRLHRISPYDIVFDITARDFKNAAKITRVMVSAGSLKYASENQPGFEWVDDALMDTMNVRTSMQAYKDSDLDKSEGTRIDGFGSLSDYYSSDMVELLVFEGDIFDIKSGTILTNHRVIVMDRRKVVHKEPLESWLGRSNKEHVGWRERSDNIWAMGPLDNLVGMQYRLDHLENLRADVFDQIAHPMVYQRGYVEEWDWEPGGRIFGDMDSDVSVLRPDATALNADFQMDRLMRDMEELVGAPRQAMGIRTPGEKTAFEVQALENAAGRIFQQKILNFEERFIEPLLNQMLEAARRNLNSIETVKVLDDDYGTAQFLRISPEDLNTKGKLWPMGARHFAKQAQNVQNLLGFINSAAYQDPAVNAHISGQKIARLFEENLGLGKFDLVAPNVRVAEQLETQQVTTQAQQNLATELAGRAESIGQEANEDLAQIQGEQ